MGEVDKLIKENEALQAKLNKAVEAITFSERLISASTSKSGEDPRLWEAIDMVGDCLRDALKEIKDGE